MALTALAAMLVTANVLLQKSDAGKSAEEQRNSYLDRRIAVSGVHGESTRD
jgi:hypothetical protein